MITCSKHGEVTEYVVSDGATVLGNYCPHCFNELLSQRIDKYELDGNGDTVTINDKNTDDREIFNREVSL